MPLVIKLAGEFRSSATAFHYDLPDLVQEGAIAVLTTAIDTFQFGEGANFTTWVAICVRTRFVALYRRASATKRRANIVPLHVKIAGFALQDTVESGDLEPDEELNRRRLIAVVADRLSKLNLSARERHILQARIMTDQPVTLRRLGETYGVTHEAIRMREKRLLRRLREAFEDLRDAA